MLLDVRPEPVPLTADRDDVVRMAGSRVTLDAVVDAFRAGATAEEIAQQYPTLALDDVYAVVTYFLRHRQQVHEYLDVRATQARQIRADNEARHDPNGIRERLLSRGTI
jgi:uncharacterized protein (DUF433 family)